jgi:hypothetical protein
MNKLLDIKLKFFDYIVTENLHSQREELKTLSNLTLEMAESLVFGEDDKLDGAFIILNSLNIDLERDEVPIEDYRDIQMNMIGALSEYFSKNVN